MHRVASKFHVEVKDRADAIAALSRRRLEARVVTPRNPFGFPHKCSDGPLLNVFDVRQLFKKFGISILKSVGIRQRRVGCDCSGKYRCLSATYRWRPHIKTAYRLMWGARKRNRRSRLTLRRSAHARVDQCPLLLKADKGGRPCGINRRRIAMRSAGAASDRGAGPGPCAAPDRCRAPVLRPPCAAPARPCGCESLQARRDGRR